MNYFKKPTRKEIDEDRKRLYKKNEELTLQLAKATTDNKLIMLIGQSRHEIITYLVYKLIKTGELQINDLAKAKVCDKWTMVSNKTKSGKGLIITLVEREKKHDEDSNTTGTENEKEPPTDILQVEQGEN